MARPSSSPRNPKPLSSQSSTPRPEQLAHHVLLSVYHQSRFASFSRQLNMYDFMRKVNLRNVDPAIDDPDASTLSHPIPSRHSPPEVVADFERCVPRASLTRAKIAPRSS
uniref:SKN7 n=1 Tax=Ganoderma boninense TaxID=34458 RepID=A0A5K1JWN8_9APHY|nr:SKN7 [Ganoderma boninense]